MLSSDRVLVPHHYPVRGSRGAERALVANPKSQYPTTRVEQFLLMATVVLLPLENHIPSVAGFSVMYIMFGVLAGYVLVNRLRALAGIWLHPVFLAGYVLLALASLIEFSHPQASYSEIFRIASMIAGAVFVASLCRDRRALCAGMYGYLAAGVWMSTLLFLTSYGALRAAVATDYVEASRIRAEAFKDNPLQTNTNLMALVAQEGAVIALAFTLSVRPFRRRIIFLGMSLFCLVATFLTMSRGGVLLAGVSFATVMFARGVNIKTIAPFVILGAGALILVPNVVLSRITYSTKVHGSEMDNRVRLYAGAVEHLTEYVISGVGAGNFWGPWGMRSRFAGQEGVIGAHNGFVQAIIYWGLTGLLALMAVIWQAYRCLPEHCGRDALSLGLLGNVTSLLLLLFIAHSLYFKEFSLGLGMLVGAQHWIWPRRSLH